MRTFDLKGSALLTSSVTFLILGLVTKSRLHTWFCFCTLVF
jgi:hypothetical protein